MSKTKGRVFIGQLGSRGKGVSSTPPEGNFYLDKRTRRNTLNVTSTNGKSSCGQRLLRELVSPFFIRTSDGQLFENWWQSGKVFDIFLKQKSPPLLKDEWFTFHHAILNFKDPLRHPATHKDYKARLKGKIPEMGYYDGIFYDYVPSRLLYVETYNHILQRDAAKCIVYFTDILNQGYDLFLLDFDGPPASEYPNGVEVTQQNYDMFAQYKPYKFGHGWVLAGMLSGIDLSGALKQLIIEANHSSGNSLKTILNNCKTKGLLVKSVHKPKPIPVIAEFDAEEIIEEGSDIDYIAKLRELGQTNLELILNTELKEDPIRQIMVDRVQQILAGITDCQERKAILEQACVQRR